MSNMLVATEDVDITLENLLSLALGSPEIGAVNFNFLHEVITEILKHLGISKKLARITQEIDYRLIDPAVFSSNNPLSPPQSNVVSTDVSYSEKTRDDVTSGEHLQDKVHIENSPETLVKKEQTVISEDVKKPESEIKETKAEILASKVDQNEGMSNQVVENKVAEPIAGKQNKIEKEESKKSEDVANAADHKTKQSEQFTNKKPEQSEKPDQVTKILGSTESKKSKDLSSKATKDELKNSSKEMKDSQMHSPPSKQTKEENQPVKPKSESTHDSSSPSMSSVKEINSFYSPTPPATAKRSNPHIHPKRSSYVVQRLSIKSNDSYHQDMALLAKSIDRRDSKTPASDMWHVLNINRRVEAAEAAIQGMTNLIDSISSDLNEIKTTSQSDLKSTTETKANNASKHQFVDTETHKQEQEVLKKMAGKFKTYDNKFKEIETTISLIKANHSTKPQGDEDVSQTYINPTYCTVDSVYNIIKDQFDTLAQDFLLQASVKSGDESVTSIEDTVESVKNLPITKEASLKALVQAASQVSRGKFQNAEVVYEEHEKKLALFEQEIERNKIAMKALEKQCNKEVEIVDISGKADKTEVETTVLQINNEIAAAVVRISSLENSQKSINDQINNLITKSNSSEEHEKKISKTVRKLEQNLENMTDNFHRTQSTVIKTQQSIGAMESASITKIKGTLFDFQEIHTKLQSQIDMLSHDNKGKKKSMEDIMKLIVDLQNEKVNEEYVKRMLEIKADRSFVDSKVDTNHFDSFIADIERNIQEVYQKMKDMDTMTQRNLATFEETLTTKLDNEDADNLKDYIDKRFKNFKPKIHQVQAPEDDAAVTRKKLISNCNCISCDRPIDLPVSPPTCSLPYYQSIPGGKGLRPFTTFELQTIRQHMQQSWLMSTKDRFELSSEREKMQKELLKLCGAKDLDELVSQTNRPCGGEHTLIEQHRRNPTKFPMCQREEHTPFQNVNRNVMETEVLGRDGHIYKGRVQSPVLPNIQRKPVNKDANDVMDKTNRLSSPIMPRPSMQTSKSVQSGPLVNPHASINVTKPQIVE